MNQKILSTSPPGTDPLLCLPLLLTRRLKRRHLPTPYTISRHLPTVPIPSIWKTSRMMPLSGMPTAHAKPSPKKLTQTVTLQPILRLSQGKNCTLSRAPKTLPAPSASHVQCLKSTKPTSRMRTSVRISATILTMVMVTLVKQRLQQLR